MVDQTSGAVSSLLGILSAAVKDEARLLSGVEGDIQFIKDEMDIMNGFLMHLDNTEVVHDEHLRAWMKQVCDIAYMAQDYIELYKRDLTPPEGGGLWASMRHLRLYLQTIPTRHSLAHKIRELKVRVREVGERRLRYDVKLPNVSPKLKPMPVAKDSLIEEKSEDFLRALEEAQEAGGGDVPHHSPSFSRAISMLPSDLVTDEARKLIDHILYMLAGHAHARKMLLCALYTCYPYEIVEKLKILKKRLDVKRAPLPMEVMLFSYDQLPTSYKSCLLYLAVFLEEDSISRTVLIRRWLAEGLVARHEEFQTMEEAGEQCFSELVLRGFLRPTSGTVTISGLKIKRCTIMNESVRDFIIRICESENFVSGTLPIHLRLQDDIRKLVKRPPPQQHQVQKQWPWNFCGNNYCAGGIPKKPQHNVSELTAGDNQTVDQDDGEVMRHPMDEMADKLKRLPQLYLINVLDLEGAKGLTNRHLKTICTKLSLKYLSLRSTEVSRLPRSLSNLWQLETLDIRQTDIRDTDMEHMFLPKLKHLLAGRIVVNDELRLRTVRMPRKLGRGMEILRHVNIVHGKAEVMEKIGRLKQLRKLGVVLDGSKDNIMHFLNTISIMKLSKCLRSLSVWIAEEETASATARGVAVTVPLDYREDIENAPFIPPRLPNKLESLNMKGRLGGSLRRWIKGPDKLSKITLRDTKLTRDGLNALGELKHLRCLRLLRGSYTETEITLRKEEFQDLRLLVIDHVAKIIAFESGAAPKLEKIVWTLDRVEIVKDTIEGIGKLKSLKEFELNCDPNNPGLHHVEETLPRRLLKSGTAFRAHQSS
ncbi:hypothetical protein HU200_013868 [Digitaria exilis]|uniref:Rx N-terminal domain-containing protein n=1 Tax=Digitaria exilis TaxID=1010633 RepID=A0A835FCH2_9POAL|nr:hypothetical protein HU200_013868 [Digitaria exilis]